MPEHVFVCGISADQLAGQEQGRALSLSGPNQNVTLQLEKLRRRLVGAEPPVLTDLLEIAAYVFAVDNSVSRGSKESTGVGASWRRNFRLVVAVREPSHWRRDDIRQTLSEALGFLSDDMWSFEFVEQENPAELQYYLPGLKPAGKEVSGDTSVVLFSGGLDSFAGAVYELRTSNRHVVLASHRTTPFIGGRQAELAGALAKVNPRRVTHVPVDAGFTGGTKAQEHTQRTRSFLYSAVGAVAAVIERADRIRFYENGVMSVNLPISEQVVGTKASRSTHPRSLMLLNEVIAAAISTDIQIDNPFAMRTKAEIVNDLSDGAMGRHIARTLSCSKSRKLSHSKPHCGACKQCLERRISTLAGGAADLDPASDYRIDFVAGARQAGEDRAMAVDTVRTALELATMPELIFAQRYAGELAWLVSAYPVGDADARVREIMEMFRRYGISVRTIFANAVSQHATALVDGTISADALLRIAVSALRVPPPNVEQKSSSARPDSVARAGHDVQAGAISTVEETIDDEGLVPEEVVLIVGREESSFKIEGLPEINGPTATALLAFLVREHRKDRDKEPPIDGFRAFPAKTLADQLDLPSDEALRAAIKRIRTDFSDGFELLHGVDPGLDALIERTNKGYRLNPRVRLVARRSSGGEN